MCGCVTGCGTGCITGWCVIGGRRGCMAGQGETLTNLSYLEVFVRYGETIRHRGDPPFDAL